MRRRVLVVEDEPDISRLVKTHLLDMGCAVDIAGTGLVAKNLYSRSHYQLVILDLMLPDSDGITLCQWMRRSEDYTPILMLTAKSTELDRVLGLEVGADDYLTKPFSIPELLARVKALFRRAEKMGRVNSVETDGELIRRDGISIDTARRKVVVRDQEVNLTAREFELLLFFARQPGRVFNRTQLLEKVWGYNHDGYEHTVNSHINRLRAKIEPDPNKPEFILTVWGVGYKFAELQADEAG